MMDGHREVEAVGLQPGLSCKVPGGQEAGSGTQGACRWGTVGSVPALTLGRVASCAGFPEQGVLCLPAWKLQGPLSPLVITLSEQQTSHFSHVSPFQTCFTSTLLVPVCVLAVSCSLKPLWALAPLLGEPFGF